LSKNRYTLYLANNCHQCSEVLDYVQRKKIDCLVINVDDEGDSTPVKVFIYPVLFQNDKLLAYGYDIIEHFQLYKNRP